eukprot:493363-Alexandrium_andersonii.AAC.1
MLDPNAGAKRHKDKWKPQSTTDRSPRSTRPTPRARQQIGRPQLGGRNSVTAKGPTRATHLGNSAAIGRPQG